MEKKESKEEEEEEGKEEEEDEGGKFQIHHVTFSSCRDSLFPKGTLPTANPVAVAFAASSIGYVRAASDNEVPLPPPPCIQDRAWP